MFNHKRPIFALGTPVAFSLIIRQFKVKPDSCLYFNSSYNPKELANAFDDIRVSSAFAWETQLINAFNGNLNHQLPLDNKIYLQELKTNDILIARRLFNRHIVAKGNHNAFDYLSEILVANITRWIEEHKPDAVYAPQVPHQYGDYLLVAVCRILKIPVFFCRTVGAVSQELFSVHSPFADSCWNLESLHSENSKLEKIALEKIYESASSESRPYPIERKLQQRKSRSKANNELLNEILSGESSENTAYLKNKVEMMNYCDKFSSTPISGEKSLVLYLHYEPEANSVPCGYKYYDQLTYATKLAALCKEVGVSLYIREHPDQLSVPIAGYSVNKHFLLSTNLCPRDINYYKILSSLPSFKGFITNTSIQTLLTQRIPCATLTGSVGLQFSIRNIPTIIGGPIYYERVP